MSGPSKNGLGFVGALAALVGLSSGCQDLSSLVTGEEFLSAPEGSPRVEVEVDFVVHDGFFASLDGVDREALTAELEEVVLSLADVGLRFYPVADDAYARGDERPARRMIVEVGELVLDVDEETIEEEGHPPYVVATVDGVSCRVTARVEKRRSEGPALVVGAGEGQGRVRSRKAAHPLTETVDVRAEAVGHEGLFVQREHLLEAVEEGAVDALRAVVKAVDRELALEATPY